MPDRDEYNGIDALDRIIYGLAGAGIATLLLAIGYAIGRMQ